MINPFYQGITSYGVRVYCYGGSPQQRSTAEAEIASLMVSALKDASSGAAVEILASNDPRLLDQDRLVLVADVTLTSASEIGGTGDGWVIGLALRPFRGGRPADLLTTGGPLMLAVDELSEIGSAAHIRNSVGESALRLSGLG